ncbi:MAG TPA: hypothetical protein VMT01_03150 [Candidatus Acidoferrum sp.]|jgi:hypothetical protein|nr:hypothetical protein [Candidatus Acidoferrum sp.]
MSSETEKIKKKFDEFEETMKKRMAEEKQKSEKRHEELTARVKALEEKLKKK